MIRPLVLGFGLSAALALPAMAALSGFYDSGAQIQAILSSAELGDKLHQLPVEELSFKGERGGLLRWKVETQGCEIDVHLRAVPPEGLGATGYSVERIGQCEE